MLDDRTRLLRVSEGIADLINELVLANLAAHGAKEMSGSLEPYDLEAMATQIERAIDHARAIQSAIEEIRGSA